jgi:hypothetical protein
MDEILAAQEEMADHAQAAMGWLKAKGSPTSIPSRESR